MNMVCASRRDKNLIHNITDRAVDLAASLDIRIEPLTMEMDILATHLNGNPLKLEELLYADDANFAHDVFGIRRHINRTTGELEDFFVPRFSQPEGD